MVVCLMPRLELLKKTLVLKVVRNGFPLCLLRNSVLLTCMFYLCNARTMCPRVGVECVAISVAWTGDWLGGKVDRTLRSCLRKLWKGLGDTVLLVWCRLRLRKVFRFRLWSTCLDLLENIMVLLLKVTCNRLDRTRGVPEGRTAVVVMLVCSVCVMLLRPDDRNSRVLNGRMHG